MVPTSPLFNTTAIAPLHNTAAKKTTKYPVKTGEVNLHENADKLYLRPACISAPDGVYLLYMN